MPQPGTSNTPRATNRGPSPLTRFWESRGSALLYVIASIALLGALGGGVAYFSSSSSMSGVSQGGNSRAYYAASGGVNYADKLSYAELAVLENSTTHYILADGVEFDLTVGTTTGVQYPVTVLGISGTGTSLASNFQFGPVMLPKDAIHLALPGSTNPPPLVIAGAYSEHGNDVAEDLVDVVTEGEPEYEGEAYIRLGNRTTQGYACLWYNGSLELFDIENYCQDGICTFGSGFRVYFEFQVVSAGADGFTFAIVNGSNNTINDCGGDTSMGELLGYAGPGVSTHGLRPAKLAVEFDTFENDSGYCKNAGSRDDDDGGHIAYVYWGTIDDNFFGTGCKTYDDNLHGAGGDKNSGWYGIDGNFLWTPNGPLKNTRNLENVKSKTGSNITYKRVLNLENFAVHSFRLEVTRSTNPNGSGAYTLKSWLDCTVDGKPCDGIASVSKDFDESIKAPDLVTNVTMDEYFHNLFDTFIFGFTEATGASAQELRIKDVRLSFKQ